jgi:Lsr2
MQKVHIHLISDLALARDPKSEEPAHLTRRFSVDGADLEIDLSEGESAAFDAAIAPYREAARPVGRGGRARSRAKSGAREAVDTAKVREWAKEQGIEVRDRGRVPAEIVAKYQGALGL